ncbi:MAG: MCE family protein [Solirubrobacterales bacterium]|nr:MCE family protein [Solirubrobacterales bacterium]
MNKSEMTIGRIAVISGFSLSCFGLLLFLWLAFGGPIPLKPEGYRVKIAFDDATTLAEQADVRTAGVSVGKVVAKELDPAGNRTLAELQIDEKYAPLRSDARAILRQKTLLGETYIELTTGSKGAAPVREDGRLANGQVAEAVEFDELLRIFDKDTRKAFQEWQASIAQAGVGRGRDLNDALGNLPVFAENAQGVVDVLNDRRRALKTLVRDTGKTFEAVTRNEGALRTLIQRNTDTFEELADRRDSLAESIRIFPTFLDESKATLARLRTFSQDTEPLIRDLDPVLEDVQPTFISLQRLSPDLEDLFDDLDPLIKAGDRGLPALSRVLRGLDPTLASAGPFLQQVNPILRFLELNQAKVADFLSTGPGALAGKRAVTPGNNSNGHVLPQIIVAGSQTPPAARRSADNRGNAYLAPDAKPDPEGLILPSFDCANSGVKSPTSTPGCRVQGPVPFQGLSEKYPKVLEGGPGGTRRSGR